MILNWSHISRELTGNRSQLGLKYKGKRYKEVLSDIKNIAELIEIRINAFKESQEPKGLNEAIQEIEVKENIKNSME